MMYVEMAIGQYFRGGSIISWQKIHPCFKGVGESILTFRETVTVSSSLLQESLLTRLCLDALREYC